MNDIELELQGIKTTSENIVKEINNLITILVKINPSYIPAIMQAEEVPSYWSEEKQKELKERNNFEFYLKDTY